MNFFGEIKKGSLFARIAFGWAPWQNTAASADLLYDY
jgi:hypothetical protein